MTTQCDERDTRNPESASVEAARDAMAGLPRCGAHHDDWPTMAQHLLDDFPECSIVDVVRELRDAKTAVDDVELDNDALDIAELIVRHRLMVQAGRLPDVARLDPERHRGR